MFMMAACLKKGHEQVAMVHTHPKPACRKTQPVSLEGQFIAKLPDLPLRTRATLAARIWHEEKSQVARNMGRTPRKKAQCCWKKATRCCRCLRLRPHR